MWVGCRAIRKLALWKYFSCMSRHKLIDACRGHLRTSKFEGRWLVLVSSFAWSLNRHRDKGSERGGFMSVGMSVRPGSVPRLPSFSF